MHINAHGGGIIFEKGKYYWFVHGKQGMYIYMGDRWTPDNAIDGRYIWLPMKLEDDRFFIEWHDEWKIVE